MKINKIKVLRYLIFISVLLIPLNLYAETLIKERNFILYAKLPLVPKIPLMNIETNLSIIDMSKYQLKFKVKTYNIVNYISKIEGEGLVTGLIENGNYQPISYNYDYKRKSKKKSVTIKYLNGIIYEEIFNPSFDKSKLTPISSEQKKYTLDPATLFLKLLEFEGTNQCNEKIKVYDGKRRYDIVFNDNKEKDENILCSAIQSKIGGYKKDSFDPLTNTDAITIKYKNSGKNNFVGFYAKSGLTEISIEEN